jgi:hypothetical protein
MKLTTTSMILASFLAAATANATIVVLGTNDEGMIRENNPAVTSSTLIAGDNVDGPSDGGPLRILANFDLSTVPIGATINSVSLSVTTNGVGANNTGGSSTFSFDLTQLSGTSLPASPGWTGAGATASIALGTVISSGSVDISSSGNTLTFASNTPFESYIGSGAGSSLNFSIMLQGEDDVDQQFGRFSSPSLTVDFTAVPEPSSTALLGLGGLALILRRRK